jgi:hypothetical protein
MGLFDRFRRPDRTFGFIRDRIDSRDHGAVVLGLGDALAPPSVSLRHPAVAMRPQGGNASCVGFMVAQGIELAYARRGVLTGDLSARAPYFWARARAGMLPFDAGSRPRDAMAAVKKFGLPTEKTCPTSSRLINTAPSWRAHREARDLGRGLRTYARLDPYDLETLRRTLAAGIPVGAGWAVDKAFRDYTGGAVVDSPRGETIGYHAMLLTGYYSNGDWDLFNQSWANWGDVGGYARVTGGFVCEAADMWALAVL